MNYHFFRAVMGGTQTGRHTHKQTHNILEQVQVRENPASSICKHVKKWE